MRRLVFLRQPARCRQGVRGRAFSPTAIGERDPLRLSQLDRGAIFGLKKRSAAVVMPSRVAEGVR